MRVNVFLAVLSLILGGLIFYAFYASTGQTVFSAVATATSAVSLLAWMGFSLPESSRGTVVFKTAAGLFFGVSLVLNVCFVWILVNQHALIIANGILLVLELAVLYGIIKSKI